MSAAWELKWMPQQRGLTWSQALRGHTPEEFLRLLRENSVYVPDMVSDDSDEYEAAIFHELLRRGADDVVISAIDDEIARCRDLGLTMSSTMTTVLLPMTSAGRFDPRLHPRGADGQFIKVGALVDLFKMPGFQHGQRGDKKVQGEVAEILPNGKIRVKVTDPRWNPVKFGETVDVDKSQIAERAKPKGTLKPVAPQKMHAPSSGEIPAVTVKPAMVPSPDGPGFDLIEPPENWVAMSNEERLAFIKERMETDYLAWRGQPTEFVFDGFHPGIALNLANTYRQLTNWDPETAKRIDRPIVSSIDGSEGLTSNAIAVAHPGTKHPGGIGPKIKPSAIVMGAKYMKGMGWWQNDHAHNAKWSTSSLTGDPTATLVHEFAHQRQFRFLDVAMRDVGKPWTDVVTEDGFGLVPDSSNWAEIQDKQTGYRYTIPKLSQTDYGHSKSSEGFAEAWAERMLGISSPELNDALDQWDALMHLAADLPQDRPSETRKYDDLTEAEKTTFWEANGKYLDLPGMRDHYPASAALYDEWIARQTVSDNIQRVQTDEITWQEREPGAWLSMLSDGWRAVYERDALLPDKAARYAQMFGDAPYGWQHYISVYVPGVKESGKTLSGTAKSLEQAKVKALRNPAGLDKAVAKYEATMDSLLKKTVQTEQT